MIRVRDRGAVVRECYTIRQRQILAGGSVDMEAWWRRCTGVGGLAGGGLMARGVGGKYTEERSHWTGGLDLDLEKAGLVMGALVVGWR